MDSPVEKSSGTKVGGSFVFTLYENWQITLAEGVIGYDDESITNLRFTHHDQFFIGVSQIGIFGPFERRFGPYYSDEDLGFIRLASGQSEPRLCPWRINCRATPYDLPMTPDDFIPFDQLALILDDCSVYSDLWQINLSPKQFEYIFQLFIKMRQPKPIYV